MSSSSGPLRAGKGTIYEPLLAVDWFPTLVTLAGGSLEQKLPLDGHNIRPVLTAGAKSPHRTILHYSTKRESAAFRLGEWKLLQAAKGADELYHLTKDDGEKNDLIASCQPEKLKELRSKLDSIMAKAVPWLRRGKKMTTATTKSKLPAKNTAEAAVFF